MGNIILSEQILTMCFNFFSLPQHNIVMSGGFPTSGSEPPAPPDSPSRTLLLLLAVCMFAVSFAIVVLVTVFLLFCRRRGDSSSALHSDRRGGDPLPDVEATLPAFPYAPEDGEQATGGAARECAVCLGSVKEGEMVRQLPTCTHLYHVACIDRWLSAHRTCPVCRSQLGPSTGTGAGGGSTISTHRPDR
ncbi:unnamed protein product [Urochloa decumbens]|uniref:RING-type E3 ubiquitin transferase n=1 Tax=Urochloa decumbens TaxID=240449 RepID=A0ABC9DP98_9POAL